MKKVQNICKKIGSSRVLIFAIILLIQIVLMVITYHFLDNYINLILGGFTLISVILIIIIINDTSNPMYKIAWIIPILLLPGIGTLFYIYVNLDSLYKVIKNEFNASKNKINNYLKQGDIVQTNLEGESKYIRGLSRYCFNMGNYPIYQSTDSKYLKSGEVYFEELLKELKRAEKFILLEYFIINNDYMWQTILNILIKKAKEGVEVKVMYDGFGSLTTLPEDYENYLKRYNIETAVFSKITPFLAIHQNNRDHRKILVIDGKVGFTGGINIADEYINRMERFGYWKDTGVKLTGEAVNSLTLMFFEIWSTINKKKINYDKYLTDYKKKSDGFVLPYSDSPFDSITLSKDIYVDIINYATKYLYITTPYLILDDTITKALIHAVRRGVTVKIIVPHIPDKMYAYVLAVSHYKELVSSGIELYEYTPGFIHAKMFIADDTIATVGTVNLDYRSLYLHFECGTILYKTESLKDIKADIEETLDASMKVTKTYIKKISIFKKIAGKILKLFAPLM